MAPDSTLWALVAPKTGRTQGQIQAIGWASDMHWLCNQRYRAAQFTCVKLHTSDYKVGDIVFFTMNETTLNLESHE